MFKKIKFEQALLYLGVIFYMYLSTTVAYKIGINQVSTASSLILVLLSFYVLMNRGLDRFISEFKEDILVILIAIFICIIQLVLNNSMVVKNIIFLFIVPSLVSILIAVQRNTTKKKIIFIILFFFLTECFLAIYEKIFFTNIFPITDDFIEYQIINITSGFRSTAFLGHPLANALCVSTIMGFIAISGIKDLYKKTLIIVGYLALLSFNSRGALLLWGGLIGLYVIKNFIYERKKYKLLLLILPFLYIINYLIENGFGDRLFERDILDGSAMTRVDVFNAFSYVSDYDFWFGNGYNYISVMDSLGAGGVENSYIVMILNYGIVLSIILFITLFFWIKKILYPLNKQETFIIISSFIVVGSMNNSLASVSAWVFLVVCARSFIPLPKKKRLLS